MRPHRVLLALGLLALAIGGAAAEGDAVSPSASATSFLFRGRPAADAKAEGGPETAQQLRSCTQEGPPPPPPPARAALRGCRPLRRLCSLSAG